MTTRQFATLVALAALWGASFLFMRVAAPQFGAVWLIEGRVGLAGLALLPWVLPGGGLARLRPRWRPLLVAGLLNAALPFVLIAWATTQIGAGVASILNATVPIFSAIFGFVVLRERLRPIQVLGIGLGFAGVVVLISWREKGMQLPPPGAVAAGLGACLSYVLAAHYTRHHLQGVRPLDYVVGSQLSAAALLLPLMPLFVPQAIPGPLAWMSMLGLALLSTALAFSLYFSLLHQVGATRTLTVTYLIPVFAIVWGYLLLDEQVGLGIAISCTLIVLGTALANRRPTAAAVRAPATME
jgi:drug/metabolite transporter (DMT)-like permease